MKASMGGHDIGETRARRTAWSITGLSAALIVAGILLGGLAMIRAGRPVGLLSHQLTIPISGVVFAGLGALVLSQRPHNSIAWMLVGLGVLTGIEVLNLGFLAYSSLKAPGEIIPAPDLSHWLAQWIYIPRFQIPLTLLLLFFPDGRLPSRNWRPIAWGAVLGIAATALANAFSPGSWEGLGGIVRNPYAIPSTIWDPLGLLSSGLLFVILLACMASVFVRFKRAKGIERQQLKWLAYTLGIVLFSFVLAAVIFVAISDFNLASELAYSMVNLDTIAIAAAVSIAVLRYRLYEIDVIINRTLVYGALSILVVGSYVMVVGTLGAIFQQRGSLMISLAATGLIAVLFQPVREGLQRSVNHLLYGERDEPYDVLSQLGRRLEDPAGPDAMLASIVETVAQTLKLPYVALALPEDQGFEIASEHGRRSGEEVIFALNYQGVIAGQLICAPRSAREPFSDQEQQLLRDIANQAAVAVHALKLSVALQQSRERLVSAREEERRRLRRDLHDGLGPQLAGLGLKLDAARNQLTSDPGQADALLQQLRAEVSDAIADVRRLVYNLRPPVLDELGLLPALRASAVVELSSTGPRVYVEGPDQMPPLPAAVEVAAYRIVQEAVTNVARHSQAEHCYVKLDLEDGLHIEILDDGAGIPETFLPGVGLHSMQERTSELGGTFHVDRAPQGGTRVVAQLPLQTP